MNQAKKPVFAPLEANNWPIVRKWARLDEVCEGVFDCPHTTPEITDEGPFVVRSQDVRTGVFRVDQAARVSEETYQDRIARAEPGFGDILYSREGTYFGLAAEVPRGVRVCLGQRMVLIRPTAAIETRFLRLWLNSPILHRHIMGFRDGSVAERLNMPTIRGLPVPTIPLHEQRAIASILGALDDKIELNRRMNETLEAMARAIFKDWFVDFGPTRAKMEGRAPYFVAETWSLFPDRLDADGKPEGWQARPVGDFAELRGGKQLEKKRISTMGTIPVFGGAGVMGFTNGHNADGFVISVGRVGAYCGQFFSHRGKAWINNNASLIRPLGSVSAEWLFQSLRHADIEVIKKGAAQPFVSNTDIANMPIIWPGENIVRRFTEILVPMMLKIEQNNGEASTLAATRDLLLPKLMSGEVRVKDAENLIGEAT